MWASKYWHNLASSLHVSYFAAALTRDAGVIFFPRARSRQWKDRN